MPETSQARGRTTPAHLPATVALASSGVLLAFFCLLGPIHAVVPEVVLQAPLAPHHQTAETMLYLLAFFVLMPFGEWFDLRLSGRVLAGANPGLAGPLAAITVLVSAGIPVLIRVVDPGGGELWLLTGLSAIAGSILAGLW